MKTKLQPFSQLEKENIKVNIKIKAFFFRMNSIRVGGFHTQKLPHLCLLPM